MGNLIKAMKERIAKSGSNKKEILYFGKDAVKRVRFLQELSDGFEFIFHNDWETKVYALCEDPESHEDCQMCQDGIGIQDTFVWSVWDYDQNCVRLLHMKATGVSPIPALIEMYEEFGTILDRDYKIKKNGTGTTSNYVVTPLDKGKFTGKGAKAFTRKDIEAIFKNAFAPKASDDEDDEEEEAPKKSSKSKKEEPAPKAKANAKEPAKPAKKKKEPTLREKYDELDFDTLKMIGTELGMTKKELKAFDDEEELIEEFFDNYEEEDLQQMYDDLDEEDEDDE